MTKKRVLLADDHEMFLEGLERLLGQEYEVAGRANDGRSLVQAAKELRPDVIVADVSMPGLSGVQATRQIKDAGLDAKIVLLTMHDDAEYATEALQVGALAYVVKQSASSELLTAIREALNGRMYVTPRVAKDVFDGMSADRGAHPRAAGKLTSRQREVLQLLTEGLSAKEIASRLGISPRTVQHHKYKMMDELHVGTTAELISQAVKKRLVT